MDLPYVAHGQASCRQRQLRSALPHRHRDDDEDDVFNHGYGDFDGGDDD